MTASAEISIRKRLSNALLAGYPLVFAKPAFRALFFVLVLAGTANGIAMAYLSVWANERFGAGPQAVAILFVVSGLTGGIGNPLIGMLSDRFGWRKGLIVGQLSVTSLAFLGRTVAPNYTTALFLVAFAGFGITGLALAMVNDVASASPELDRGSAMRIIAAERTAWSIGIIIGPAIGAAIVAAANDTRPAFAASALTQFLAIAAVLMARIETGAAPRTKGTEREVEASPAAPSRRIAMGTLFVALVLITLPTQTRNVYLPLFVTTVLREPAGMVGPLFTLTAIVAVATMPYIGAAADRFGAQRVLYLSALVGAVYCVSQAISTNYLQTMAGAPLIGIGIALWTTSSLIYLQQSMPGRAGSAGGLYVSAQQVTPLVAGLLLGPIAEGSGVPAAFSVTAVLCIVTLGLLAVAHQALRKSK